MRINGREVAVDPGDRGTRLLDYLRSRCGLTGAKEGCGVGECGSCVVVVDGSAQTSCLVLTGQVEHSDVRTVEGLAQAGHEALQEAFIVRQAVQCGYCIPGVLNSCSALLDVEPDPAADQIATALDGNLCRCTAYQEFTEAVRDAARARAGTS